MEELLELLARDEVLDEVPTDLTRDADEREALPELLGHALRQLRFDVAEAEAFEGRDPIGRDTAVLRLFHQLLYVRIAEDRGRAHSAMTIRQIADAARDDAPNVHLTRLLSDYRARANSELFEPAGVAIEALPPNSLRKVLRETVEPWARLRLDFSVARTDLAGRLYESYLKSLPTTKDNGGQRLFAIARGIDAREKLATFYTPPALARLLTRRALDAWARGRSSDVRPADIRVVDPACGSGAFLIAAYEWLRERFEDQKGRALRPAEREELLVECIHGADVDERALGMAQVQLLEVADLHGRLPSLSGNLHRGDALAAPPRVAAKDGQVPWEAIYRRHGPFTTVVGNPPFGSQAKLPTRLSVEEISALSVMYEEVRAFGQDYAYFFLALGLRLLSDEGTAAFVMPRGLLSLAQGAAARVRLASEGIDWIGDLRAARVFPGVVRRSPES